MTLQVRPASDGGWLAFASGPRLLAVASADDAFVAAAWAAIALPTGFQALLDLLTSKGLGATPSFALLEWESGADARLIVRGELTVEVTDAAGTQSLSAVGVSTWVERTLPGLTGVAFAVPAASAAGTVSLPLDSGVALVASIEVGAATPAAPVVAARPKPVPTTIPAPVDVEATMAVAPEAVDVALNEATMSELPADPSQGYDYLFGETMHRSVAEAAVREPEEDPAAEPGEPLEGDHDGHTVLTADIAKVRGSRKSRGSAPTPAPAAAPDLVLVLSTGAREPLSQPILVGRSPSVSKVSGGQIPRLVTIGSIDQDISRNHVQFALEGGTVVVTDLHSKNGTSILLPGKDAQKLRAGEPTSVIVGTVIDLGSGLTFTVEEESAQKEPAQKEPAKR